jgi:segregation and condensation protein B
MLMRLVRDEPDVRLDEVRAEGTERDATVFTDLAHVREPAPAPLPLPPLKGSKARKARTRMSSKLSSQVVEVPDFAAESEEGPGVEETGSSSPENAAAESADTSVGQSHMADRPIDDMSDGAVPPQEPPIDAASDETDSQGAEAAEISLATLEALLLTTHHPLTPVRLNELLGAGSTSAIRAAVQTLNESYEQSGRSFRIEQVAGGYQILTLPEHGEALRRLHQKEADAKLTKAALETMSIIAYKQPILRADIEAIRGVACGETIRSLMEKHLVKIAGRAEEPGRPILYGTTKRFLELFGLNSLKDLPKPEEFKPVQG